MKYTIEEMQFANTVTELASKLRNAALNTAMPFDGESPDASKQRRVEWQEQHPHDEFIPLAVRELERVFAIIQATCKA